jgi:hypothetical protein
VNFCNWNISHILQDVPLQFQWSFCQPWIKHVVVNDSMSWHTNETQEQVIILQMFYPNDLTLRIPNYFSDIKVTYNSFGIVSLECTNGRICFTKCRVINFYKRFPTKNFGSPLQLGKIIKQSQNPYHRWHAPLSEPPNFVTTQSNKSWITSQSHAYYSGWGYVIGKYQQKTTLRPSPKLCKFNKLLCCVRPSHYFRPLASPFTGNGTHQYPYCGFRIL